MPVGSSFNASGYFDAAHTHVSQYASDVLGPQSNVGASRGCIWLTHLCGQHSHNTIARQVMAWMRDPLTYFRSAIGLNYSVAGETDIA